MLALRWKTTTGSDSKLRSSIGRYEVVGPNQNRGAYMFLNTHWADTPNNVAGPVSANGANHVVLLVEDYQDARAGIEASPETKRLLRN